jgi:signal peptidase II
MNTLSKRATIAAILLISIGCDQLLKYVAGVHLRDSLPVSLLGDFVRLQYAENKGVMLSMGASLSPELRFWAFIVVVGVLLMGMLAYVIWSHEMGRMQVIAWTLVVSGGLGNLIDRLARDGVVIDYISIGVGVVRTAVFNLADALVFVGVALLLLQSRKKGRAPSGPEPNL